MKDGFRIARYCQCTLLARFADIYKFMFIHEYVSFKDKFLLKHAFAQLFSEGARKRYTYCQIEMVPSKMFVPTVLHTFPKATSPPSSSKAVFVLRFLPELHTHLNRTTVEVDSITLPPKKHLVCVQHKFLLPTGVFMQ